MNRTGSISTINSDKYIEIEGRSGTISVIIQFSQRKSIAIKVTRKEGKVAILAPHGITIPYLKQFLESKINWIEKQLAKSEDPKNIYTQPEFTNGASYMHLGKLYTIRTILSSKNRVSLIEKEIIVECKKEEYCEKIIQNWQLEVGQKMLIDIFRPIIDQFGEKHKVYPKKIEFKYVKGYWGQCTAKKGIIRINMNVIRAPQRFIEYIMVHELCHMLHPNHSKAFWNQVEQEMPDYKEVESLVKLQHK